MKTHRNLQKYVENTIFFEGMNKSEEKKYGNIIWKS